MPVTLDDYREYLKTREKFQLMMLDVKIREKVYSKTGGRCFYCGNKISKERFHVDHFVPLRAGGDNRMSNFVPSCVSCNLRKGSKGVDEWRNSINKNISKIKSALSCLENILNDNLFWFEREP